ncbi:MAG: ATP-NAD kinase family protein [Colwellia sp.]|nr:ATP-NAD kinase family protein [Colwellia sp.]
MYNLFKLGFIINPIAGIGGSVALKGSDGVDIAEKALALGATAKANERASIALEVLLPFKEQIIIYTASGLMGEQCAKTLGFQVEVVYNTIHDQTSAEDTEKSVIALLDLKNEQQIDLLLFAGGDGTARNINDQVGNNFPVLGIPAGCKIHSGVYAITPKAAGRVVELMLTGQLVTLTEGDVMDIDESLFRQGVVKAKRYGEMQIPSELRYVQAVKSGGKESDELVLQDIAAHVIEHMEDELFIIGSGSTTAFVMEELSLDNTLLGIDLVQEQMLVANDLTEHDLWAYIEKNSQSGDNHAIKLVITLIGGQGHIFGRGNQQLSPRVLRAIGKENIMVIATKSKLASLDSRPLISDTGDVELDQMFSGFIPVITGYKDQVLYPVASPV